MKSVAFILVISLPTLHPVLKILVLFLISPWGLSFHFSFRPLFSCAELKVLRLFYVHKRLFLSNIVHKSV